MILTSHTKYLVILPKYSCIKYIEIFVHTTLTVNSTPLTNHGTQQL